MNISKKNETKDMHRIAFRASNIVNGKVFHLLLWEQWRFKMVKNEHLIHFISQTSSVTPYFFLHLNISFSLSNKYADFEKIL